MTTSFTTTEDFGNEAESFGVESDYPTAFGVSFTPQVIGITIGAVGALIAGYLAWSQLLPVQTQISELQTTKEEREAQLAQLKSSQFGAQIPVKQQELERAQTMKTEVEKLFAQDASLETFLIDLNSFANFADVKMSTYTPSPDKTTADPSFGGASDSLLVQTFNFNLEGSFRELQLFLQDLERIQPLMVVQNFNLSVTTPQVYLVENQEVIPVGEPTLSSTVTVAAVFANASAPPPPAEAPAEAPPAEEAPPQ
ncbi:MAG: type II and III secretion system protein [Cyanobacterium sp. T60_A2020_053]|nr:type II and III secretion system protein [Cyanobacterium sp. T60_A2020_053]